MTARPEETPLDGESPAPARRSRPLGPAGHLVDSRLSGPRGLQARYRANESSGRADVAVLRRAAGKTPGEIPEAWALTAVETPAYAQDAPTWEEIAVHTAMTLYAVHQQSRSEGVFVVGRGLGRAARDLIGPTDQENPSARARFNALVTAGTISELRHHLRGFVSQLRARGIPLDHAMLADDLVQFQRPGGAKSVRLRWARQYAALPTKSEDTSSPTSATPSTSTSEN